MNPVVELNRVVSSYLRGESTLEQLQLGVVPLLPYFAERLETEPSARLAVDLDSLLVEYALGESTETEIRALIESALPAPTTALSYPPSAPSISSEASTPVVVLHWSTPGVTHLFTAGGSRVISGNTPLAGAFA